MGSPRFFELAVALDTSQHLFRKLVVLERAGRPGRKSEDRLPVGRTLLQAHATCDHRVEEFQRIIEFALEEEGHPEVILNLGFVFVFKRTFESEREGISRCGARLRPAARTTLSVAST